MLFRPTRTELVQLRCRWDLSPAQESWITSAVFIGMMLGSYTWGSISDRYGRKVGMDGAQQEQRSHVQGVVASW